MKRQPSPLSWPERFFLRRIAVRLERIAPEDRQAGYQLDAVNVLLFADLDHRHSQGGRP